tara:strand:- start:577 stop:1422 length:846 start_codon:yes stop_codon:yes gene_type:complete
MKKLIITLIIFIGSSCSDSRKIHHVTGVVLDINLDDNKILIDHDSIPNFMMPMIMPFNIENENIVKNLNKNDSVKFKFIITEKSSYATDFNILGKRINNNSEDDFWEDDEYSKKEIGDKLSNVTLLDINAKAASLNDYSGKFVFISFIFTRCPVPNMCPAVVIKNGVIARNFKDNDNIKLVMVSFDYLYDTPEILKSFYESSIEDFPNWDVLSSVGKVSDLYTLSSEIGCKYWGIEKNNIGHNLRSALIGPDKTLLKIWEGDDWLAGSVSNQIESYIKFSQ